MDVIPILLLADYGVGMYSDLTIISSSTRSVAARSFAVRSIVIDTFCPALKQHARYDAAERRIVMAEDGEVISKFLEWVYGIPGPSCSGLEPGTEVDVMVRLADLSDALFSETLPEGRWSLKTSARRRIDAIIEPLESMDEIVECMVKMSETSPRGVIVAMIARRMKELYNAKGTDEEESDGESEEGQ